MFLKFGIASNEIIMRIVLGKSENLQNKGYRRSTSNSGHTHSKEEFAQRGELIYQKQIRPQVELENQGKIVAINIETGAFEVADTPRVEVDRLYEREPDAQPWVIRVGHRAVFRFGSRRMT